MPPIFQSFLQGGFEGATHRRLDGRQLDVIAASGHDQLATTDYSLASNAGLSTVRDTLRWHLIEQTPGHYDWSSVQPMLDAACLYKMQVIWDLCHFGIPHWLDIWSAEFIERFAAYAAAAAAHLSPSAETRSVYCPINEISYWSWAGGDTAGLYPYGRERGNELKRQLVKASVAAMREIRHVNPSARFLQPEPIINIVARPDRECDQIIAETYRQAQFDSWDMLAGRLAPELGGNESYLDLIGVNYYFNNQWMHEGETMGLGHRLSVPLREMLVDIYKRYNRPISVSETSAEGSNGPGWLHYIAGEVRAAMRVGVPMIGLCIYPIMDYPGWDDDRHCHIGLIQSQNNWKTRSLYNDFRYQIEEETMLLKNIVSSKWS